MTAQKWSQEQLQEPVCKITITLLQQGLGGASPHDITLQFPIRVRPTVQQVLGLAAKTQLFTTEGNFLLLVKRNTGSAELSQSGGRVPQIYVPMIMRPWVLRGCHADSVCHFGVTHTLQMLQRFYWWVGLDQNVRWWIRRYLFCQARKTSHQTIRWPTTLMPLPSGPGQIVSVDYFGLYRLLETVTNTYCCTRIGLAVILQRMQWHKTNVQRKGLPESSWSSIFLFGDALIHSYPTMDQCLYRAYRLQSTN